MGPRMAARIACSVLAALTAGAFLGGGFSPAHAADPSETSTAVLGFEAVDAPDKVATEVTDALRQRVASSKGFQLVQGKDLMEIKLVFSCSDEAPGCMAQAGKSLGVAKLIYGNVKQAGGEYVVSLKLLDVARAALENSTVEKLPTRASEPNNFRALAPQWLSRLTGKGGSAPAGGVLQITCNVPGATVALDGTAVGVTAAQPLAINDVAPGKHEIVVQKGGYESRSQQFTMGSGQALPLSLTLTPGASAAETAPGAAVPAAPGKPADGPGEEAPHGMARPGFWIAVAFTVASAGAATYFGLRVQQINKNLDPFRGKDLSPADKSYVQRQLDDGDRAHTYQVVSLCVGGAFALAGGFLYYKGFLDKEGGSGPKTSDNRGLRIFPTGTASSGGIVAEFDF